MQIVIDIPQGLKIDFENENWTALTCAEMKNALMRGTQLPKNHGRLIDADKMIGDILTVPQQYEELADWCCQVTAGQPTIIEADKEKDT